MPVLMRIAFRNLLEHKSKTLIIGILLALGVVILVVGNAFMDTAALGVKETFTDNFTGDIFIAGKAKNGTVSLFGVQAVGGQETTPVLPYYDKITAKLDSMPQVAGRASQITGFGIASLKENEEDQTFALLFGVDPADYRKLFSQAKISDGRFLQPGEEGIVVSKHSLERMNKQLKKEIKVGDKITLTGMGSAGFKIRTVPLVGLVEYKNDSEANDFITYVDVNTARILQGLTIGNDEDTVVSDETKNLLAASDEEALFGGEEIVSSTKKATPPAAQAKPAEAKPAAAKSVADTGAWQFILVKAKSQKAVPAAILELNAFFAQEGIEAQASDWKAAAGPFSQSIDVVRIVFNIAIIIVAVVAVIIMMNTLVISVIERTGEIGTMRALGAQRGFVRKMFFLETMTIAVIFGVVGLILGFGTIGILNAAHISASNPFLQILFAGKVLHAVPNPMSVVSSLVLVMLVAVLAHFYPVSIALKIEPVRAMQTE
jgi:putative ABC transport system permease protein